jgi:arginyl-tRNA synthetase
MEEVVRPEHETRKKAREVGQDPSILENRGLLAERDAYSKQIENGEPESMTLWKKFRDVSTGYYQELYARLNIKFDEYAGESQVSLNSEVITEVESVLKDRDVYEEQDGAWVIGFDKHGGKEGQARREEAGCVPPRGRNGSTTYLLRDIARRSTSSKPTRSIKWYTSLVNGKDIFDNSSKPSSSWVVPTSRTSYFLWG